MNPFKVAQAILLPPVVFSFCVGIIWGVFQIPDEWLPVFIGLFTWTLASIAVYVLRRD